MFSISEALQAGMMGLGADLITDIFVYLLIVLFVLSIILTLWDKQRHFTAQIPSLLTTLGILGTFVGIVVGLLAFDVQHIDQSINLLLEGLKTAFITSLFGVGLAILFKVLLSSGLVSPWVKDPYRDLEMADLYQVMLQQSASASSIHRAIQEQSALLHSQHQVMHEIWLPTSATIQQLHEQGEGQRAAFEAFEERLTTALQEFAVMMSRSASEQMIKALKDVIHDFNHNLTEQFGENFKRLNEAVMHLVQWQENYKQQLSEMQAQLALSVSAISHTEHSLSNIQQTVSLIPESMHALSEVIEVNQHQINELGRHLTMFDEVKDRAFAALPQIHQHIEDTVSNIRDVSAQVMSSMLENSLAVQAVMVKSGQQIGDSIREVHQTFEATEALLQAQQTLIQQSISHVETSVTGMAQGMISESQSAIASLKSLGETLLGESDAIRQRYEAGLANTYQQVASLVQTLSAQQAQHNRQILDTMAEMTQQSLQVHDAQVQTQLTQLNDQMQHYLQQSAQAMESSVTRLNHRFVTDYQRLVKTALLSKRGMK